MDNADWNQHQHSIISSPTRSLASATSPRKVSAKRNRKNNGRSNHVKIQSRTVLVATLNRLLQNDTDLNSISFDYNICPLVLRDNFVETLVQLLGCSKQLQKLELYIGSNCKALSLDGIMTLGEYIRTNPTLNTLKVEGDETVTDKANHLIKAAAENPNVKELHLRSIRIHSSSLQATQWEFLSVSCCAMELDTLSTNTYDDKILVDSLELKRTCAPSLIEWLLPRLENPRELDITLETFPRSMVSKIAQVISSTSSLSLFHFHIGFCSDGPIHPSRSLNRTISDKEELYLDASSRQLESVVHSLSTNSTIEYLSLSLPRMGQDEYEETIYISLKCHIQNNLQLIELGALECTGMTISRIKELQSIHEHNEKFLKQAETGVDDLPPSLWPELMERCLKSNCSRGREAIFQRLCDQRIAPY